MRALACNQEILLTAQAHFQVKLTTNCRDLSRPVDIARLIASEISKIPLHERMLDLKTFMTGLFAFAWLVLIVPMVAIAGTDTEPYLDGDVKEAIASGETILLHYKSTW